MEKIKGDVLLNINEMKNGESFKLFSLREDLFLNEKVEIYEISREDDFYYISINKKIGFNQQINTKEKISRFLLNKQSLEKYKMMELSNSEMEVIQGSSNELYLIKEKHDLRGVYENGIEFTYPCIIKVEKTEY